MSLYTFRISQFEVKHTRAINNDTDVVTMKLSAGVRDYGGLTHRAGDVNDGHHDVGLEFGQIPVDDPSTLVSLSFMIANAGHNDQAIIDRFMASGDAIAGGLAGTGKDTEGWGVVAAAAIEVVNGIIFITQIDCDGVVAADMLSRPQSDFDTLFPVNGRVATHTKNYPGSDSNVGCGSNSNYNVTTTLIRTEPGELDQPDPTAAFILLSRSSGLVLDVPGLSQADGAQIQQYPDNGGSNQHWQLVPADGGFFKIRSLSSGLVLDVPNSSHHDGAIIQQFHDNGTTAQQWEFVPVNESPVLNFVGQPISTSRFFKIRSRVSGKVLDVPGRSPDPQKRIQQFSDNGGLNQQWQLVQVGRI